MQLVLAQAQRLIGLALSSGGARGIAHIGVLKTLQEANIPVDLIAGPGNRPVSQPGEAVAREVPLRHG